MFYSPNRTDLHTETAVHTFVYVCGMGFTVFQFINIRRALFNTLSTSSTLIVVYLYCSFFVLKFFYHFITIYIFSFYIKYLFYSTFSKLVPPHSLHFLGLHLPSLTVPHPVHFHFAIFFISPISYFFYGKVYILLLHISYLGTTYINLSLEIRTNW